MIGDGYTIFESSETLRLVWSSPTLPAAGRALSYAALAFLPALFFLRDRAARHAAARLNLPVTPRQIGIGAPLLSALTAALLYFAGTPQTLVSWDLGPEGIHVKSLNGESRLRWDQVAKAHFDARDPKPEEAALILESADGKQVWLVVNWLQRQHRERVLARIEREVPGKPQLLGFLPRRER